MEATLDPIARPDGASDGEATEAEAAPALTPEAVFDAHAPFVGRALRCLGVREHELADACQEVFLVAAAKLGELERRDALRSWLYAICLRRALAYRRRAARRREDPVAEPPTTVVPATQDHAVEQRRALAEASAILDALDQEKRAVFVLSEVEQLQMHEVAAIVGCPVKTAYSRLYAARREIARALRRRRSATRPR